MAVKRVVVIWAFVDLSHSIDCFEVRVKTFFGAKHQLSGGR